jgi:Fur family ferric uptake transcriptional regulator
LERDREMEEMWGRRQPAGAQENYQRTKMREEMIFRKLKERGCRITRQRQILLNIILKEECGSCKEIYYKARKEDARMGAATVYRMINLLEEIGAISRKNMYTIPGPAPVKADGGELICSVWLDDNTARRLSIDEWYLVTAEGLRVRGHIEDQNVTNIMLSPCSEEEM